MTPRIPPRTLRRLIARLTLTGFLFCLLGLVGCGGKGAPAVPPKPTPPPAFWTTYQEGLGLVKLGKYGEAIERTTP